jgi:orotate phosphoribosyltransferase
MTTVTASELAVGRRKQLIQQLQLHALKIGKVVLSSGREADYYVDVKQAILRPPGFWATGILVSDVYIDLGATAVGGLTMGADPIACAAMATGINGKAFFVRKEAKGHGLQRRIEGPPLGGNDRALVVEDVVTSGSSTIKAIDALYEEDIEIVGVVSILDRLAGGGEAIREDLMKRGIDAPYTALTTIDDVYPTRPDK